MTKLRNLGQAFGKGGAWERRLLLWLVVVAIGSIAVVSAAYYFDEYTESAAFCGAICHANYPEYVAHKVSDHADVECGTCHIGPGLLPKVSAKIYGVGELVATLTNSFDRPIELPVERMRPASVTCEQCHSPQRYYEDRVHAVSQFAQDEDNSKTQTLLVLRTGGETTPGAEFLGIHWHADNPVYFVSRDPENQEIPWVATLKNGELVEYQVQSDPLTSEELAAAERQEMDCMDCHNRATHEFRNPEERVDEALAMRSMDRSLPYLKREAMKLLLASYSTQEEAVKSMEELSEFYRSEYPTVYSTRQQSVDQAVEVLQQIYTQTTFPSMNLTWETYPDNLGHTDSPGCFRCHDGGHVSADGDTIPLGCSTCHSIPVVATPGEEPDFSLLFDFARRLDQKPDSHMEGDFIWDHRILANDSCAACHGSIQYGTDNSSFCANGACHGGEWPEAASGAQFKHPIELTNQHAEAPCYKCHGSVAQPSLEKCAECHAPATEPHFGDDCSLCHSPVGWAESAAALAGNAPSAPHRLENAPNCLLCHGEERQWPMPATHEAIPVESCVLCHSSARLANVPPIPHSLEARDDCVACHGEGGIVPMPEAHAGRTSESCLLCHETQ